MTKRQAQYSQQAHQAVKRYEVITDAPKELLEAMTWAMDTETNE